MRNILGENTVLVPSREGFKLFKTTDERNITALIYPIDSIITAEGSIERASRAVMTHKDYKVHQISLPKGEYILVACDDMFIAEAVAHTYLQRTKKFSASIEISSDYLALPRSYVDHCEESLKNQLGVCIVKELHDTIKFSIEHTNTDRYLAGRPILKAEVFI